MRKRISALLCTPVLLFCACANLCASEPEPIPLIPLTEPSTEAAAIPLTPESQSTADVPAAQEDPDAETTQAVMDAQEIVEMQNAYAAYADLVTQYEAKYGTAALEKREYLNLLTGLCFIRLVDFDQNGIDELVLVYNHEAERSSYSVGEYSWEVWSYANGQAVMLNTESLYMTNGGAQSIMFTQYDGKWYLISGSADSFEFNYYYGFDQDQFGLVREALKEENSDSSMSCSVNGAPVSVEEWNAQEDAWLASLEFYRLNYVEDAADLFTMYAQAKTELGLEASDSATAADADYILPSSSQEYLTRDMLAGLNAQDLLIARNEIFARHGRKFSTPELQQHFDSKSWYTPKYTPEEFDAVQYTELSAIEWANIDLISTVEQEVAASGSPITSPSAANTPAQAAGVPVDDPASVFSLLPENLLFSSGVGAWGTTIQVSADGSFTGQFHDSNMGDIGEGYPGGSVSFCDFSGKFSSLQKISDFIYSMKLETLNAEGTPGESYIADDILYIYSDPYGMEDAEDFLIYLPGTPISEIEPEFLMWAFLDAGLTALPNNFCGIYNVNAQHGFIGYY